MSKQQQSEIIKNLIFDIAHSWIGQEEDNCEDQREEYLPRYNFCESTRFGFHYELRLWKGTSVGINCSDYGIPEDWTESRTPINGNSGGKVIGIIVGQRPFIDGKFIGSARYHWRTFDKIGILSEKYNSSSNNTDNIDNISNILKELKQFIDNLL